MSKKPQKRTVGQLEDAIKQHFALELKSNPRRSRRNGHGLPLSAWMAGAPKTAKSKIDAVTSGKARYPYHLPGDGARTLARAIANRYDVTHVQAWLIEQYVVRHYRGAIRERGPIDAGTVNQPHSIDMGKTVLPWNALETICRTLGRSTSQLPLRALIDHQITNALLLLQLKESIERKTPMVCKI